MNAIVRAEDAPRRSVLVVGASCQIGVCLLPLLIARGVRVVALSRAERVKMEGVTWRRGSLPDAPALTDDIDALLCFGPLDALAAWLQRGALQRLAHVVATSSMSADSKRASPIVAERALAQRLRDAEAALFAACADRGIACTILRPTLIYGVGRDRNLTPLARRAARWRAFPLPTGHGLRQPVHAEDVARATCAALDTPASAGRTLELGGGERITAAEMFARVRAALPVRTAPLYLPRIALACATRLMPSVRGPLSRLDEDLVADNVELERLLGVRPRAFRPDARSFGFDVAGVAERACEAATERRA